MTSGRPRRSSLSAIVSDAEDSAGIARACLEHRYTQQEIADHLGVHDSTISRRMRAVDGRRLRNTMRDGRTRPRHLTLSPWERKTSKFGEGLRWTGVLEKRDGRWVIVQMHASLAVDKVRDIVMKEMATSA